jgi:hypothetical protein
MTADLALFFFCAFLVGYTVYLLLHPPKSR